MPTVSIIMPTYARPHLINRAIDSVRSQTYNDWEMIIVDDNDVILNSNETKKVVESYSQQDKRIKYIKTLCNMGGAAARNIGINNALGKYIAFIDDDDIWLPEKLHRQISKLKAVSSNVGLIYCKVFSFLEDGSKYKESNVKLAKGYVFEEMLASNFVPTISALIRKECFEKVGYFDETLPSRQDHDMFLRIAKYYEFDFVDDYLSAYYAHENRISRDSIKKEKGWQLFLDKWEHELNKKPKVRRKVYYNYHFEMGKIFYLKRKKGKCINHLIKAIKFNGFNFKPYLLLLSAIFNIKNIIR